MSLLGRLFGSKPPPPPPNSVLIDEDLVASIAPEGASLQAAVNQTLRDHIAAEAKAEEARRKQEAERMPFWLRRDAEQSQIEDELRDRVIQRQTAGEEADVDAAGRRAGGKQVESSKQIEIGGA